jgi:hypothetical protein
MTTPLALQGATLRITAHLAPPVLQLRLDGELDLACADLLDAVTSVELAGVDTVTVDLGGLGFCESQGCVRCSPSGRRTSPKLAQCTY